MHPASAAILVLLALLASRPVAAQRAPLILERIGAWGCMECSTGHQFGEIAVIAVTVEGTIHLIDRDEPRVRVFGRDGALLRAWGRRGRGPGELETPAGMALLADGTLHVADLRTSRLTTFTPGGSAGQTLALKALPTAVASHPALAEVWVALTDFQTGATVERWIPGLRAGERIVQVQDFPPSEGPTTIYTMALSPGGVLAIGDGRTEYRIRRYGADGRPAGADIVRNIPKPVRTAEEIAAARERLERRGSRMRQAMERERAGAASGPSARAVSPVRNHFDVGALQYDGAGRLWVRTERGEGNRTIFDVFDPAGTWLGEVDLPARVGVYHIAGEWLAAATRGEDDLPRVGLWRLRSR